MGLKNIDFVIMCPNCIEKELSRFSQDYTEYYTLTGLEFLGCSHLSIMEIERFSLEEK